MIEDEKVFAEIPTKEDDKILEQAITAGTVWIKSPGNTEGVDVTQVNTNDTPLPVQMIRILDSEERRRLTEDNETFEEYRARIAMLRQKDKEKLRGKSFWIAKIKRAPDDKSKGKSYNKEEELKKLNQKYGNNSQNSNNQRAILSPVLDTPETDKQTEGQGSSDTGSTDVLQR